MFDKVLNTPIMFLEFLCLSFFTKLSDLIDLMETAFASLCKCSFIGVIDNQKVPEILLIACSTSNSLFEKYFLSIVYLMAVFK